MSTAVFITTIVLSLVISITTYIWACRDFYKKYGDDVFAFEVLAAIIIWCLIPIVNLPISLCGMFFVLDSHIHFEQKIRDFINGK